MPKKGEKMSEEQKKKIARGNLGKFVSEETRRKLSLIMTANPPRYWLGKKFSEDIKKNLRDNWHKNHVVKFGFKFSDESKRKMSERRKGRKQPHCQGEKHWNWKGGITKESEKIRCSMEYKQWRDAVFKRDNWSCVICGDRNYLGRIRTLVLNADHIKSFAHYPKLRFDINNGRTLCLDCHQKTETFGGRSKKL